jgi:hypothetical protein
LKVAVDTGNKHKKKTPLLNFKETDSGTFEMQKFYGILDNCQDAFYVNKTILRFKQDETSDHRIHRHSHHPHTHRATNEVLTRREIISFHLLLQLMS